MQVHVVATDWRSHGESMRRIREEVFVREQGVAAEEEDDGQDEAAAHFIALNEAGLAFGTARLLATGQIGRIAVLAAHRRSGIGRRLLDAAVAAASEARFEKVFLHAQVHALSFYRRAGFDCTGEQFMEAGIAHQNMERLLPIAYDAESSPRRVVNRSQQPESKPVDVFVPFEDEGACLAALLRIANSAKRSLAILSPALDSALFGDPRCVEIVSNLARRAPATRIRMLVEDTRFIADSGHRLLQVALRLPSKIDMRRIADDLPGPLRQSYMLADGTGLWVMPDRDAYSGFSNSSNRVETRRLLAEFDALFDRSAHDPELRLITL